MFTTKEQFEENLRAERKLTCERYDWSCFGYDTIDNVSNHPTTEGKGGR